MRTICKKEQGCGAEHVPAALLFFTSCKKQKKNPACK
jgi:hypothetical protein